MLLAGCQNESAAPSPVQYKPYQDRPAPERSAPRRSAKTPEDEASFKALDKIQNEVRKLKDQTAPPPKK